MAPQKNDARAYAPALWYSKVLPGGRDRHAEVAGVVIAEIELRRTTMRGVSEEVRAREADAVTWLIEALTQAESHLPPLPLVLPFGPVHYTASVSYPVGHGYKAIKRALDALVGLGWLSITMGAEHVGFSRLRPADALLEHCRALACSWVLRPEREASRLLFLTTQTASKGKSRRPLTDEDGEDFARMRANLLRMNEVLRKQCIHLRAPDELLFQFGECLLKDTERKAAHFGQTMLYRTFSSRFDLGGRFYGPWWQNLPRIMRPYIWINEWQGLECDFSGMAVRCLYAQEGLPVPDDPYDIGLDYQGAADPRREVVKEYVNSSLNDKKGKYRPSPENLKLLGMGRTELKRRVLAVHAGIAHHFGTDAGLRMQRVDADIAERVMLRMLDIGAVCLPIHDSFIVQAPFAGKLVSVMEECFNEVTGAKARLKGVDPVTVQHYTEVPLGSRPEVNEQDVRARIDAEYERFSIANTYFGSWADQMWGPDGWSRAMQALDLVPPFLLPHHAFPLPLLVNGEKG